MQSLRPCHIAIPSNDMQKSRQFYWDFLEFQEGRTHEGKWIDYNFYGHQLVVHFAEGTYHSKTYKVGDFIVPSFGVTLSKPNIDDLLAKLQKNNVKHQVSLAHGNRKVEFKDFTGNYLIMRQA